VRSINCYYSNLIEGHDTHPIDIERALKNDYSADLRKRNLQLEAKAHIATQQQLDAGEISGNPYSLVTLQRIHKEFLSRLPDELLVVRNPNTKEEKRVEPGVIRDDWVQVGEHIPPPSKELPTFLERF
jgi:Fic family protein